MNQDREPVGGADFRSALNARFSPQFWIGGHSLGGALALLAGARLQLQAQTPVQGLYTFGQPRVGNYTFATAFDEALGRRAIRFVNNNDVVPQVPLPGPRLRYWHTEHLVYIDGEGELHPDLPLGKRLRNSFQGAMRELDKLGREALRDHTMNSYIHHVREAETKGNNKDNHNDRPTPRRQQR